MKLPQATRETLEPRAFMAAEHLAGAETLSGSPPTLAWWIADQDWENLIFESEEILESFAFCVGVLVGWCEAKGWRPRDLVTELLPKEKT